MGSFRIFPRKRTANDKIKIFVMVEKPNEDLIIEQLQKVKKLKFKIKYI